MIIRDHWQKKNAWGDFEKVGWRRALHDGVIAGAPPPTLKPRLRALKPPATSAVLASELEIVFRPDPCIWDGQFANNGWLQELPKPVTKLTWDNAALISPALARERSLENGDMVELRSGERTLRLPVWITPGQAERTIGVYLGGGRTQVGRVGVGAGFNTYQLRTSGGLWSASGATLRKLGETYLLATTQEHHTIDSPERQIIRDETLAEFIANPAAIKKSVQTPDRQLETLFDPAEHPYNGYRWAMSIGLDRVHRLQRVCPWRVRRRTIFRVVGKEQVARGREMHWIRVDTYFSGSPDEPAMNHQPVPVYAVRKRALRTRLPSRRDRPRSRRIESPGVQSLRRHPFLLEQLPLQSQAL